jgi:hypothetical protein
VFGCCLSNGGYCAGTIGASPAAASNPGPNGPSSAGSAGSAGSAVSPASVTSTSSTASTTSASSVTRTLSKGLSFLKAPRQANSNVGSAPATGGSALNSPAPESVQRNAEHFRKIKEVAHCIEPELTCLVYYFALIWTGGRTSQGEEVGRRIEDGFRVAEEATGIGEHGAAT